MKEIKVLGPGCAKCKSMYGNVMEALKASETEATVTKVEDMEEILSYNVLTTPVLIVDGEILVKGRIPTVSEISTIL